MIFDSAMMIVMDLVKMKGQNCMKALESVYLLLFAKHSLLQIVFPDQSLMGSQSLFLICTATMNMNPNKTVLLSEFGLGYL
jgi:hypothetical protein